MTLNAAVVAPAATETLAGTERTSGLAEVRAITAPPTGAGPEIVIDPVELSPPVSDVGANVIEVIVITETVVAVDLLMPLKVAVTLTVAGEVTCFVIRLKVAEDAPDLTNTEAGTVPAALSVESTTDAPAVGQFH